MPKKKELFVNDVLDDEEDEEIIDNEEEEDYNNLDLEDNQDMDFNPDDETPSSPMGLAHQISKESDTYKNFKDLPREVKFSFLDKDEKYEVKHHSRAYRTWKYIEKIIDLRVQEDKKIKLSKMNMLDIQDKEGLIEYLKSINRDYLINDIEDLNDKELKLLVEHISKLKDHHFLNSVESKKENIKELYDEYLENNDTPRYIDDMDNIGKVIDTSITSMGYKGNASQHSVMTINAVKNENIEKDIRKERSFSFLDAIKGKLG